MRLIPAAWSHDHDARAAACDGTWMGPFTYLTWQRPAPGRRANGSRSRRPRRVTVSSEALAMARSRRPPEWARGVMAQVPATEPGRKPKSCPGDRNRRTRVPQGSLEIRQGSQGARRGSQKGSPRPSGPVRTRPWVADEAPAYPSHPRPTCRGRTACAGFAESEELA